MAERSYHQYCGIAYALDIVGERWTLLIIRELMLGPRRYKDLLDGLPGIGTNLLSDRLKKLMNYDVIRQRDLPPPAASTVYELTGSGRDLESALIALGDWGSRYLGTPDEEDTFNPRWLLLALDYSFLPEKTEGVNAVIEFEIDGEALYAHIKDGTIETRQGRHPEADLTITADNRSFLKLVSGGEHAPDLDITLDGDESLLDKLSEWFDTGEE